MFCEDKPMKVGNRQIYQKYQAIYSLNTVRKLKNILNLLMFGQTTFPLLFPNCTSNIYFLVPNSEQNSKSLSLASVGEPLCQDKREGQETERVANNYKKKISELQDQILALKEENKDLRAQIRPKRHYSKRRTNLDRCYICPQQKCGNSYSSRIALHCHLKKKHSGKITLSKDI